MAGALMRFFRRVERGKLLIQVLQCGFEHLTMPLVRRLSQIMEDPGARQLDTAALLFAA